MSATWDDARAFARALGHALDEAAAGSRESRHAAYVAGVKDGTVVVPPSPEPGAYAEAERQQLTRLPIFDPWRCLCL